jgi:CheY-like chemotaxis protein
MAKRILVIEDDPSIRTYLQKVLRQAGYDTLAARDGEEGLQMVRALLPDLVLCDVSFSRSCGTRATTWFQRLPHQAH